jgi:DNA-binding transcriptional ArsR family regulator
VLASAESETGPLKAKLLHGISDPSRLAILEAVRFGRQTVSQIVEATGLGQPNVSNHLACLRGCGLVRAHPEGRYVYYALSDARVKALLVAIEELVACVGEEVGRCDRSVTSGS